MRPRTPSCLSASQRCAASPCTAWLLLPTSTPLLAMHASHLTHNSVQSLHVFANLAMSKLHFACSWHSHSDIELLSPLFASLHQTSRPWSILKKSKLTTQSALIRASESIDAPIYQIFFTAVHQARNNQTYSGRFFSFRSFAKLLTAKIKTICENTYKIVQITLLNFTLLHRLQSSRWGLKNKTWILNKVKHIIRLILDPFLLTMRNEGYLYYSKFIISAKEKLHLAKYFRKLRLDMRRYNLS